MDEKLVLQLKKARFPLKQSNVKLGSFDPKVRHEDYYIPTLSELIEACGEDFGQVFKRSFGDEREPWGAFDHNVVTEGNGSTPEEAVAHLWLALHAI
jgi:hypothetical protein